MKEKKKWNEKKIREEKNKDKEWEKYTMKDTILTK